MERYFGGRAMRLTWLIAAGCLMHASVAFGLSCFVDTDCPGTACGTEVCEFFSMVCQPAGTQPGMDGWCHVDTDCKCHSLGATCNTLTFLCTFTQPPADMAQP